MRKCRRILWIHYYLSDYSLVSASSPNIQDTKVALNILVFPFSILREQNLS